MADRSAPGLTLGQLVTLTFGFLAASVLIFAFGYWVGYDVAQQYFEREQQVVRLPAPAAPTATVPVEVSTALAEILAATSTPEVRTPTRPPATATRPPATATPRPTETPTAARRPPSDPIDPGSPAEAARGWTVQAMTTTDTMQAVMLARRLREKGYDAYTVTTEVGDLIQYRVRVGRFTDRTQARVMEIRLREEEGLGGAFVVPQ